MDTLSSVGSIFGLDDNSSIDPQLLNDHTLSGAENDDSVGQMSEEYNLYSTNSITSVPNQPWQPFTSFEDMPPPAPHYQEQMMRHRRSFSQPPEDIKHPPPPPMVFHRSGQLLGESTGHAVPNPAMDDLRRRLLRDRQANNTSRNRRGRSRPYPDPRAPRTVRPGLRHAATEPCIPDTNEADHSVRPSSQPAPTHAQPVRAPASAPIDPSAALQTIINRLTIIAKASDETKVFLQHYLSSNTPNTTSANLAPELEAKRSHNRALNASVVGLDDYLIALPVSSDDLEAGDVIGRVPVNGLAIRGLSGEELSALMAIYGLDGKQDMFDVEMRIAWCRFVGCGRELIQKIIG